MPCPSHICPRGAKRPQTDGIRLPQSLTLPFSIRVFFFIMSVTVLAVMMPLSAGATAKLTGAPSALSFGNVVVGHAENEVLVLTNDGPTSIKVSEVILC